MLNKFLMSTTALAGVACLMGAAHAGSVGSSDNMSLEIEGKYRFNIGFVDQDVSAGFGRGARFVSDEAEIKISATNTADNGIEYGVTIEVNALPSDTVMADEVFGFVDGDVWGRIEMGDQDDATSRMHVSTADVMVGRAGMDGDVADFFQFGTGGGIDELDNDETSDATKVTYFTPRFGGFQLGASYTPDDGSNGASVGEQDNDGNFENVLGLGSNYEAEFGGLELVLSLTGEFGDSETSTGAATEGDLKTISVGGSIEYDGFAVGAEFVEFAEKGQRQSNITIGEDSGSYWAVAAAYSSGRWGVSIGYFESEKGQPGVNNDDTEISVISLDGEYEIAPGWTTALSVNLVEADNINATVMPLNNSGSIIILNNTFNF